MMPRGMGAPGRRPGDIVEVPRGQEGYFSCPKCGERDFDVVTRGEYVYNRIDPRESGLQFLPMQLRCACGYAVAIDKKFVEALGKPPPENGEKKLAGPPGVG